MITFNEISKSCASSLAAWSKNNLSKGRNLRVIDPDCNEGIALAEFKRQGFFITGFETDPVKAEKARNLVSNKVVTKETPSAYKELTKGRFSAVFSTLKNERDSSYISELKTFVRDWRFPKDSGLLFVTTTKEDYNSKMMTSYMNAHYNMCRIPIGYVNEMGGESYLLLFRESAEKDVDLSSISPDSSDTREKLEWTLSGLINNIPSLNTFVKPIYIPQADRYEDFDASGYKPVHITFTPNKANVKGVYTDLYNEIKAFPDTVTGRMLGVRDICRDSRYHANLRKAYKAATELGIEAKVIGPLKGWKKQIRSHRWQCFPVSPINSRQLLGWVEKGKMRAEKRVYNGKNILFRKGKSYHVFPYSEEKRIKIERKRTEYVKRSVDIIKNEFIIAAETEAGLKFFSKSDKRQRGKVDLDKFLEAFRSQIVSNPSSQYFVKRNHEAVKAKIKELEETLEERGLTKAREALGNYPFQKLDSAVLLLMPQVRHILAYSMGLGKTIVSAVVAYLTALREDFKRILVFAPSRSGQFENFEQELRKWGFSTKKLSMDLMFDIINGKEEPNGITFYVLSEQTAKNSEKMIPLALAERRLHIEKFQEETGKLISENEIVSVCSRCYHPYDAEKNNRFCEKCGDPLWAFRRRDGAKKLRFPVSELIKRNPHVFRFSIVDEGHENKSRNSARGIAARNIIQKSRHALVLTGTPSQGKASDIFYVLGSLLRWKGFYSYKEFKLYLREFGVNKEVTLETLPSSAGHSYAYSLRKGTEVKEYEAPGFSNIEKMWRLSAPVMIRRRKRKTISLPQKDVKNVMVQLNPEHQAFYNLVERQLKNEIYKCFSSKNMKGISALLWGLRAASALPESIKTRDIDVKYDYEKVKIAKFEELEKILEQLVRKENRKVIIFSSLAERIPVQKELMRFLLRKGYYYLSMTSKVPPEKRPMVVHKFNRSSCPVLVASTMAANIGLNITGASAVVFMDLEWSPDIHLQAEDRIYRIGQKRDVKIYYLINKDTIEEDMFEVLIQKSEAMRAFTDGEISKDALRYSQLIEVESAQVLVAERILKACRTEVKEAKKAKIKSSEDKASPSPQGDNEQLSLF